MIIDVILECIEGEITIDDGRVFPNSEYAEYLNGNELIRRSANHIILEDGETSGPLSDLGLINILGTDKLSSDQDDRCEFSFNIR